MQSFKSLVLDFQIPLAHEKKTTLRNVCENQADRGKNKQLNNNVRVHNSKLANFLIWRIYGEGECSLYWAYRNWSSSLKGQYPIKRFSESCPEYLIFT